MRERIPNLHSREVIARILADFGIVHVAAIMSLLGVLLWRLTRSPGIDGAELTVALRHIYLTRFVPLSLIFPVVFSLSDFYSQARSYSIVYKWRVIGTGSVVATLIYLFADFLITRADVIPRSSTVLFLCFVSSGTIGIRWLKNWLIGGYRSARVAEVSAVRDAAPVLVVGGAGYIGCLLCRRLLDGGRKVRLLDSLVYGDAAIRELLVHPSFELITGDCRSIQSVVSAVKGVDSIVHLAAIVGDPACEQDRQTALEINYAATRMLIEIARGNGVARLVFASSCSVYGATDHLMNEKSAVAPISLYAQTKVDSEQALLEAKSTTFHPTVLRLATVFGHSYRPRFDLVVNLLAAKAFKEGLITIFNGEQWRPFIHVRDVADGIIGVLQAPLPSISGEIFNLGDSRLNYTLSGVADQIRAVFRNTRVEQVENGDRRNYRVSFGKIRNQLGFECSVTLEAGIRELKSIFEQGLVTDYTSASYHNQRFLQNAGPAVHANAIDAQVMAAFADPGRVLARSAATGD
jgi:nucleoside-diphosphate-sugar epimerase